MGMGDAMKGYSYMRRFGLLVIIVTTACNGTRPLDAGAPDQAPPRDTSAKDVGRDLLEDGPAPDVQTCTPPGAICATQADCCPGFDCVDPKTGVKVCLFPCDLPCGGSPGCTGLKLGPSTYKDYCLTECTPAIGKNDCPDGLACHPTTDALVYADAALCLYPACVNGEDCPVRLAAACDPLSPAAQCTGQPAGAFCAADAPGSTTGHCVLPGTCDPVSGLCLAHALGTQAAKVGDPCNDDRDCGGAMFCEQERVDADGNVYARNGYCSIEGCMFAGTLPLRACPTGAICNRLSPGGRCFKACALTDPTGCRNHAADKHGDYECYDWSKLVGGPKQPTCEPALPCGPGWSCPTLGDATNSTDMGCRDRATGAKLPDHSPAGFCLDTTASGP